jgi:hypothetical protein
LHTNKQAPAGAGGVPVPEPVMLTFTGLASRHFGQARRQFT